MQITISTLAAYGIINVTLYGSLKLFSMKKLNWLIVFGVAIMPATFSASCKSKKKEPVKQEDTRNDPAPVIISPDASLQTSVDNVLAAYNGVSADIKDGVVTLRGTIRQDELMGLVQKLQELRPKKVETEKLTIK